MKPLKLLMALCVLASTWGCQKQESELPSSPTESPQGAVQGPSPDEMTTSATTSAAIQENFLSQTTTSSTTYSIRSSKVYIANYGTCNMITYTPAGASQTSKRPVIVFIPGNGEYGTNASELYTYGPLKYIKAGWHPKSLIVAIQPRYGCDSRSPRFAHAMLTEIRKNPAVDLNRVYLTGLSGGAYTALHYVRDYPTPYKIRAIMVFSMGMSPNARDVRFANVPAWGMAGTTDTRFEPSMKSYFTGLMRKGYKTRYYDYAGGHYGWNTYYNPYWRTKDGYSVYTWLLKWK